MNRKNDLPPGASVGWVLILGALLWIALAYAAFAQTYIQSGGDTLLIRPHPVHAAEVYYSNSQAQASASTHGRICLDDVCVLVDVNLSVAAPAERLTVTADDGYLAIPDQIDVLDGDAVTVLILRPMF